MSIFLSVIKSASITISEHTQFFYNYYLGYIITHDPLHTFHPIIQFNRSTNILIMVSVIKIYSF